MTNPRTPRRLCLAVSITAALAMAPAPPPPAASASSTEAPPFVTGDLIPVESSSAPKPSEWASAKQVRVNRGAQGECTASLLREWFCLRCPKWLGGGLVAGDPAGVTVTAQGSPLDLGAEPSNHAVTTITFPARRGHALIFSFLQKGQEYMSASYVEAGTLSFVWRSKRPDPVLVMRVLPEP